MAEPGAVCVISHSHADFSKGGGEVAAQHQVETLRAAGRRTFLVAGSQLATSYAEQRPMPALIPHGADCWLYGFRGMAEDRLAWTDPAARTALVSHLAGLDTAIYHFHHYWRVGLDLMVELMEARPEARFVLTLHEMLAICLNHGQMVKTGGRELCREEGPMRCLACFPDQTPERFRLRKATLLSVLRRFDAVLCPSDFLRGRYAAWGLDAARLSVLENYLGDAAFARPRDPAAGIARAARFGFFGQPTAFKGLDVLLRALPLALRARPDITLMVHGAEREDVLRLFPALEATIDAAGPALSFAGRYDSTEAVGLMQGVGWVIVPSVWWENSPVVIQEARRAGTPLIVSDIGGMAEKAPHGVDGLQARRGDPADFARMMVEAASPDTRQRLGESLRDSIPRDAFLDGLAEAYAD
jgi:glycosyltransferase involved in cell wall biosynthesis